VLEPAPFGWLGPGVDGGGATGAGAGAGVVGVGSGVGAGVGAGVGSGLAGGVVGEALGSTGVVWVVPGSVGVPDSAANTDIGEAAINNSDKPNTVICLIIDLIRCIILIAPIPLLP
jgi:hypothetical protein